MTGKSQPGESEGLNRQTLVRNQLGRLKRERISALTSCLSCPLASAGCLEDRTEKVRSIGRLFLARVLGHPKRSTGFEASCHHPPPATPSLKRMCSTHPKCLPTHHVHSQPSHWLGILSAPRSNQSCCSHRRSMGILLLIPATVTDTFNLTSAPPPHAPTPGPIIRDPFLCFLPFSILKITAK